MQTRLYAHEDGLSLIEATIILMVLFLLTAVLSPSVADYVNDARQTKGKEDVEAIGLAIQRYVRDTGYPFLVLDPQASSTTIYQAANRVDLLISDGTAPTKTASTGISSSATGFIINGSFEWDSTDAASDNIANMAPYFVSNQVDTNGLKHQHTGVDFSTSIPGGPRVGLGWRGPYLSAPIGPDPWGHRYAATTAFLNPSTDSTTKGTNFNVIVLTAGSDGNVDTQMAEGSTGTTVAGDDLVYVLSGGTR
jgi:type II secretory pathway pseudopilin PulG